MKEIKFTILINTTKEKVWNTLWLDKTFLEWASIIDPGTYMMGELKDGMEIQFISSENGYGVTSLVEKLIPGEYLLLRHSADTQENGERMRENQWTGGKESYLLTEKEGQTVLTITLDIPEELNDILEDSYPKALERVKILAEKDEIE